MNKEMEAAALEAEKLYGDILYIPHHVSKAHHPAPRTSRAAQFSPFAALSGYDDAIRETARLTDEKPELSEQQKQLMDEVISSALNRHTQVMITFFRRDEYKEGGSFESIAAYIRNVTKAYLETEERVKIPLEDIIDIIEIQNTGG